jgi:hypothetical protein
MGWVARRCLGNDRNRLISSVECQARVMHDKIGNERTGYNRGHVSASANRRFSDGMASNWWRADVWAAGSGRSTP